MAAVLLGKYGVQRPDGNSDVRLRPDVDPQSRLVVSAEVQDLLTADALAEAHAAREHTKLTCARCSGVITPESGEPASLIVSPHAHRPGLVAQFTHERCGPSVVQATPVAPSVAHRAADALLLVRPHGRPAATVIFGLPVAQTEVNPAAGTSTSSLVSTYAAYGFTPSPVGLGAIDGPMATGVRLGREGSLISLVADTGPLPHELTATVDGAWLDQATQDGAALVIIGANMGLGRPDEARFDALLASNKAVAALVPFDASGA